MSLLATVGALFLTCLSFLAYDVVTFRDTLTERLQSYADIVGANSASAVLFNDASSAERTLRALQARDSLLEAALYTAEGRLFASWTRSGGVPTFASLPFTAFDTVHFHREGVDIYHPVILDRSPVGTIYIRSDLSELSLRVRRYLLISGGVLIISVLFATLISLSIGRRISLPLLNLADVAQSVSQRRDYSVRVAGASDGGEVGLVVKTFNEMLSQIQQRGEALQTAKDELEQKVVERTAELQRKEEELYQSRRLESVGRLAGGVAHDFNNLLTGIIGCSESLEEQLPPESPLAQEVHEIKRAGERASVLTRQLLAFGRKQIISPQVLDLGALMQTTGKLLRRLIGEDISLLIEPAPDLGRIHADPGQIDQILVNMAVNARDAMPTGGRLVIRAQNLKLDSENQQDELGAGEYVMISISDTGTGMPKEVIGQIFEPFFTTKERGKGTGLGLATVYGIVKQNRGGIRVYSQPGMGSTFKIILPRHFAHKEAALTETEMGLKVVDIPGGTEKILIVEDEPLVANYVSRLLKRKGYQILVANSGRQAMDVMNGEIGKDVDLVLTDVIMPEMNGRQMVESIRPRHPGLRVLYMSGYPADVIAQHDVLQTNVAFIEKPFRAEEICRRVRDVLDAA